MATHSNTDLSWKENFFACNGCRSNSTFKVAAHPGGGSFCRLTSSLEILFSELLLPGILNFTLWKAKTIGVQLNKRSSATFTTVYVKLFKLSRLDN